MRNMRGRNLRREEWTNLETTSAINIESKATGIELVSKTIVKTETTVVAETNTISVISTTCTRCTTTKWCDCTTDSSTQTMFLPCRTPISIKIGLRTKLHIVTLRNLEEIPILDIFTAKASPQTKPDSLKWDFSLNKCNNKAYSTIFLHSKECFRTKILTITEDSDFIVA